MRTIEEDRSVYRSESQLSGTFYLLKENRRQKEKEDQQFIVPWQMTESEEELESESVRFK